MKLVSSLLWFIRPYQVLRHFLYESSSSSFVSEYLYLPAVRTQYASEYGHTIRVLTIYQRIESSINAYLSGRPDDTSLIIQTFAEGSRLLEDWFVSLPAHLRFSQENVAIQQSMLGTPSNTGAWCYAILHVFHASCTLALTTANTLILKADKKDEVNVNFTSNSFTQPEPEQRIHGAIEKLKAIMAMLKEKMKCGLMCKQTVVSRPPTEMDYSQKYPLGMAFLRGYAVLNCFPSLSFVTATITMTPIFVCSHRSMS